MSQQDVDRHTRYNQKRQREYGSSELTDENTTDETKKAVLTYLQPDRTPSSG